MGIGSIFKQCDEDQFTKQKSDDCNKIPYGDESNTFAVRHVTSPHILEQSDSNKFLIFDYAGTGILRIPDNLLIGSAALVTNVGGGTVEMAMDGLETMRGIRLLSDPDAFITVFKLTGNLWQTSERI